MDLLTFHLGDREFGVDLGRVLEILNPPPITRVPEMPPALLGLIGLRGDPTGVVDAGLRLEGRPVEPSARTPVLILRGRVDDRFVPFGLLVEAAGRRVSVEKLLPSSDGLADLLGRDACIGFADLDGRLVLVLDVDRLLVFPPLPAPPPPARERSGQGPPAPTRATAEAAPLRGMDASAREPHAREQPRSGSAATLPLRPSRDGVPEGAKPSAAPPQSSRSFRAPPAGPVASAAHVPAPRAQPSGTAHGHAAPAAPPTPLPTTPAAPQPRRPDPVAMEPLQRTPLPPVSQGAASTPPHEGDPTSPPSHQSGGRGPGLRWVALAALIVLALLLAVLQVAGEEGSPRRLPEKAGRREEPPRAPEPRTAFAASSPVTPLERPVAAEPVAPVERPSERRESDPPATAPSPPPAAAPATSPTPPPPSPPARKAGPIPQAMRVTPDTPACEIHEVRRGDTLWWISARRLGSPYRWPELFGENRGQLVDPDVIEVHDRIRIPGGCAPSPAR